MGVYLPNLTARERDILEMRYGRDIPAVEISGMVGLTVRRVEQITRIALKKVGGTAPKYEGKRARCVPMSPVLARQL
jgi:DNA-directed RNA polymerase sigma subunit (sigma70/sigma32)